MISKSCKYAFRAVACIALHSNNNIKPGFKTIAKEIDAPEAFTAKVLQILVNHKTISSMKGPFGGFFVTEQQLNQPIINIVNAIDGNGIFNECGMGLKSCSENHPCPMHSKYKEIRDNLINMFSETTVRQLSIKVEQGLAYIGND